MAREHDGRRHRDRPADGRFCALLSTSRNGNEPCSPARSKLRFTSVAGLIRYDLSIDQQTAQYRIIKGTHPFGLNGITFAAGAVWVASPEENAVFRVDPHGGKVEARIPVRRPWWLSSGDGGIWVSSDEDGIERIDPATNSIAATAPVPEPIDEVRVGGGYAWATNAPKGIVYKVDAGDPRRTRRAIYEPSSIGSLGIQRIRRHLRV